MKIIAKLLLLYVFAFPFKAAFCSETLYVKHQSDVHKLINGKKKYSQIQFAEGIFLIPDLVFHHSVELVGSEGSTILKPVAPTTYMIIARSDLVLKNLVLDGKDQATVGVYATQDLRVESCTLQNFYGNVKSAGRAIRTLGYSSRLIVINTTIRNVGGYEDGKVGNSIGAHRGIHSFSNYNRITNSTFENINGKEDGDAIHLQTKRISGNWTTANSVIENCTFINFGKRAIKLQSSDNIVKNCYFTTNIAMPAASVISMYGANNSITENEFNIAVTVSWISFNGANFNFVIGNKVKMKKGNKLFYVAKTSNTQIDNNQFQMQESKKPLVGFSPNTNKTDFSDIRRRNNVSQIQ